MNELIMWVLAASAVLGGADKIFGNRLGLGKHFDEGFQLLGPLVSGMTGILCLSPIITEVLQYTIAPLYRQIGLDPGTLGGILPIDMGGFQLAAALASDPRVGKFAGIFTSSTFGCTLIFSIPVGFSMMKKEKRPSFLFGILCGLICLPALLVIGGLFCGLSFRSVLFQSTPILVLSLFLAIGIHRFPERMVRIFTILARIIEGLSVAGILAGLTEYLTGTRIIPGLMPFSEALLTASLCGIIMIGSLPFACILQRVLQKPLSLLGRHFRMKEEGITALLLTLVSLTASFGMIHDADERDIVINAAFLVSAVDVFGPHLSVCTAQAPELITAFIFAKLLASVLAVLAADYFLRKRKKA